MCVCTFVPRTHYSFLAAPRKASLVGTHIGREKPSAVPPLLKQHNLPEAAGGPPA